MCSAVVWWVVSLKKLEFSPADVLSNDLKFCLVMIGCKTLSAKAYNIALVRYLLNHWPLVLLKLYTSVVIRPVRYHFFSSLLLVFLYGVLEISILHVFRPFNFLRTVKVMMAWLCFQDDLVVQGRCPCSFYAELRFLRSLLILHCTIQCDNVVCILWALWKIRLKCSPSKRLSLINLSSINLEVRAICS